MKTSTSEDIIKYLKAKGPSAAKNLSDHFGISRQALFKHHLPKLQKRGQIAKVGRPPKVFYYIPDKEAIEKTSQVSLSVKKIIDERYLIITPSGKIKEGLDGFEYWCIKNKLDIPKTADEYIKTLEKYDHFKKNGLIDGMVKMKQTFKKVYVDKLFYLDFYSLERFGKTKLGQMLLYAKQSQDKKLIKRLSENIAISINSLVKKYKINGVGFIPPTVKREVQFINELRKNLKLPIRKINLVKLKTQVAVPQKTLSKLNDRIENASTSIIVDDYEKYNNILLIDDAVGSGATINETARQIRNKKMCKGKIISLSITGSYKGFDVISEV
ncbi:MAG: hypothetical protein Q8P20_08310 [bacterium]|nr:hypothetical protein [bacterium]